MTQESTCNLGNMGLIPGLGKIPEEENDNSFQYLPENPIDRGTWQATVMVLQESGMT